LPSANSKIATKSLSLKHSKLYIYILLKKIYLLTITTVSFQLVNEPVNKASLSFGEAGYLNTTGIVFFPFCDSASIAC
jgi:hypothetical protein